MSSTNNDNTPVSLIAHSKCGYSLKQIDVIKKEGFDKDIEVVYCDVKTPGELPDERCKDVQGFPTFFSGSKQIHVGYTKDLNAVLAKKSDAADK